jgi:hypothetical protein
MVLRRYYSLVPLGIETICKYGSLKRYYDLGPLASCMLVHFFDLKICLVG